MLKEKCYPFTREGLNRALQQKDYITTTKEVLENRIEIVPVALLLIIGVSVLLTSPMSSAVAYKTFVYDSSMVAFKYLGGF